MVMLCCNSVEYKPCMIVSTVEGVESFYENDILRLPK